MDQIADRVWVTGCTRERQNARGEREHGVLGRLLRRDRSSIGLGTFLLLFSAAGFLAPQLADCESLDPRIGDDCVCGLFLFFSLPLFLYFYPSVSLTTQTRRCCANLTRFRWLSVSSSIAETDDDGDRPACPRRNGSPRLLQV